MVVMTAPKVDTPEAKFTLKIEACQFNNLDLQALIEKLTLIKKLHLQKYYTVEDARKKEPDIQG